ncbi:MAG: hypothetical protein WDO73_37600 [Ignavibacteriota bacterium]
MKTVSKRLLLFAATTGYQIREFAGAAQRLGIDVTLATDRCLRMDDPWGDGALPVKFDHRMVATIEGLRGMQFDGGRGPGRRSGGGSGDRGRDVRTAVSSSGDGASMPR